MVKMSRNFRLSCLVTMVTILLGSHFSFTSARHTVKSSKLQPARISKRDVGLEACLLHPRNCPGGFMDKRGKSLIERLQKLYPSQIYKVSQTLEDQDSSAPFEAVKAKGRSAPSTDDALVKRLVDFLMSDAFQSYDRRKTW